MRGVRVGSPALVEVLLHGTAAPIQLQVQTKDALLKTGMGKRGNILLPPPEDLEHGQTTTWMWPREIKAPSHVLGGTCFPLGTMDGKKPAKSTLGD